MTTVIRRRFRVNLRRFEICDSDGGVADMGISPGGAGQPWMNLVIRPVGPCPADETQCPYPVRRHIVEFRDERVVRHILKQFNALRMQLSLPAGCHCASDLHKDQARDRRLRQRGGCFGGALSRCFGGDDLIAQTNRFGLRCRAVQRQEPANGNQTVSTTRKQQGLHGPTVIAFQRQDKREGRASPANRP